MPTNMCWLNEKTILVEWQARLTVEDLKCSFESLAHEVGRRADSVDIVFDIADAGHIPVDAPMLALRSGFLNKSQTRHVIVVGMNYWAQVLARAASRAASKPIIFYRSYAHAAQALRLEEDVVPVLE